MKTQSRIESARRLVASAVALCLTAAPAVAGIVDSPLPVLEAGKTTLHLYSVPGIIQNGFLSTFFGCTSTDTATMRVGVEVFGSAGGGPITDAVATSLSVAAGATVYFGCSGAVGIGIQSNLACGGLARGSARILATSKKLARTAFIADVGSDPATSMVSLTIIKKTEQKGE
jgi:hypothetical protein